MNPFVRSVASKNPFARNRADGKVILDGDAPWENIVDLHGQSQDAGWCRRLADVEVLDDSSCSLVAGVYRLAPGTEHPLHIHPGVAEFYYVLRGEGKFLIGDEEVAARPGTALYIPPGLPHGARAGAGEIEFFYTFPTGDITKLGTTFIPRLPSA